MCISKKHSQTAFVSSSDENFIAYISGLLEMLGIPHKIKKHWKHRCWYVVSYREKAAKKFKNLLENALPLVLSSPLNCQLAFVEGIIDAEGCVLVRKYRRNTRIYTYPAVHIKMKSYDVLKVVSLILERVHVGHSFFYDRYNTQWKLTVEGTNFYKLKTLCGFSYKLGKQAPAPSNRRGKPPQPKLNPP